MKIHHRYAHLLFSLIMSIIVAGIVTCALTLVNHGLEGFFGNWGHSFIIAWVIAFTSVLLFAPQVRKLVQHLTAQ